MPDNIVTKRNTKGAQPHGKLFLLTGFTVVFALSIATTLFNKRALGLPAAIGVPIVSAIFVFLLQWAVSLLGTMIPSTSILMKLKKPCAPSISMIS